MEIVKAIDKTLGADGHLVMLREDAKADQRARRDDIRPAGQLVSTRPSGLQPSSISPNLTDSISAADFSARAGQFFFGAEIDVRSFPAEADERVFCMVPSGFVDDPFVRRPRRGLVVGVMGGRDETRLFGLDNRHARRRLTGLPPDARLLMTKAYVLDDLSIGILWAVANLDEALLDDDAALA
ncbi:hypothetical protein K7G98_33625, partial [Saccharothrix sp. MB29]|nr:hypothetical protein [Saccharothrix sp. MB29]